MYGNRITTLRNARGISQENLAKMLGIKQNQLSDIGNDKRVKIDEDLLTKIAKELGVSVADIKSNTPIVMNFTTNDTSHAIGQQQNFVDNKILDVLVEQLKNKDNQLDKLITLLNTKN